jgi:hypothetical protein
MLWVIEQQQIFNILLLHIMSNYLHSSVNTPMRDGLRQMLRQFNAPNDITLSFHEVITMERSTKKISRWYLDMQRRLFGRNYQDRPAEQRFEFLLLPETAHGYLHFHGLIHIPATHFDYFHRIAAKRWNAVAPRGELLSRQIGLTDSDHERLFTYITKGSLAAEVLHSSMLRPPAPSSHLNRSLSPQG